MPESPVDVPEGTLVELWVGPTSIDSPPVLRFGSAKGLIQMGDDFDDPIPGFED